MDLRFANARPTPVRQVPWFWLAMALLLAALGAATLWSLPSAAGDLLPKALSAGLMLLGVGGAAVLFVSRTTEALEFTSAHGGATLVSITGGIGSARAGKTFFVELIRNINAAKLARPQSRQPAAR